MTINNAVSTIAQASWASTVSDYILTRRQQTLSAYAQPHTRATLQVTLEEQQSIQTTDDWLFKTLFTVLAKQLEEGHTVLTLSVTNNHQHHTQCNDDLYAWQQLLLEILAQPLLDLMDDLINKAVIPYDINNETTDANSDIENNPTQDRFINQLKTLLKQGEQLLLNLSLSNHERHLLKKNHQLIQRLYTFFKVSNQSQDFDNAHNSFNSFNTFIKEVENHPLMTAMTASKDTHNSLKNSLSSNLSLKPNPNLNLNLNQIKHNPIIYKIVNEATNNSQATSITLWLHRTWQAEHTLARGINAILNNKVEPLPLALPDTLNDQQIQAINIANNNALSIITGGPGTGKTYTVAQLVIALHQAGGQKDNKDEDVKFSTDSASLTLAAPTGKAAQRMQESLQVALNDADVNIRLEEAKTIHRLLGIGRDGRPRYNADNPLGENVIIIDEASMLGVELANHLVSSIKSGSRLILLGDANQLAAVDAGAVLADLRRIPMLQSVHATLIESRRFDKDSGIGKLAQSIKQDKVDLNGIWKLFNQDKALNFRHINTTKTGNSDSSTSIKNSLSNKQLLAEICANYQPFLDKVEQALPSSAYQINLNNSSAQTIAPVKIAQELIKALNKFRVLCAGHHRQWGDDYINDYLTQWHISNLKLPLGRSAWFHGRPVMILHNSYELGLFNGDIGICLRVAGSNKLEVFFENKTQGIAVNLLNDDLITTAYAMTIHKSQGSEFDHVTITFDSTHSRLLSKELIYTAVTRAKKQVTIYSTKSALEQAVTTPTIRQTGLEMQFASY